MSFIGLLRTLEAITRAPRLGHDVDVEDSAEELAEREAETECLVPEDFYAVCRCAACVAEERAAEEEVGEPAECECWPVEKPWTYYGIVEPGGAMEFNPDCPVHGRADTPNPTEPRLLTSDQLPPGTSVVFPRNISGFLNTPNSVEPGLTPDELVGVRGLLQERYEDGRPKWLHELLVATGEWAGEMRQMGGAVPPPCDHRYCEKQGYGLCFGVHAAQIDFIEDTKSFASNHAGTGAEPNPSPTIVQSAPPPTVDGEGGGGVLHSPGARLPHPDDAVAEWIGEAVVVIGEVLAGHRPIEDSEGVYCEDVNGILHASFEDRCAWRQHVAPLIANALAPHDK